MVTNGTSRASRRSPAVAPSGITGPRVTACSASSCTAGGKSTGMSKSARIRRNASRNGGSSTGARTTAFVISTVRVHAAALDRTDARAVGIVRSDERDRLERIVADGDELLPAGDGRLRPRGGDELGAVGLEEP